MKKILGVFIVVVLFLVLLVSTMLGGDDEVQCDDPASSGSSSGGASGESIAANAEGLAEPLGENTLDHITSQYKSPDRPGHRGDRHRQGRSAPDLFHG